MAKSLVLFYCLFGSICHSAFAMPKYVVSLAVTPDGVMWAGTDGDGLWKSDDNAKSWIRDASYDEVGGDCAFCLYVDVLGHLWSGSLANGVCVYNGSEWKSYNQENGFPGSRVFAVTGNEKGDVWIATDGGLVSYSEKNRLWQKFTRADGLIENEIVSLVDEENGGGVLIGYATSGMGTMNRSGRVKSWSSANNVDALRQINCLYRHSRDRILVGTAFGLFVGKYSGSRWTIDSAVQNGKKGEGSVCLTSSVEDYITAICKYSEDAALVAFRSGQFLIYHIKKNCYTGTFFGDSNLKYPTSILPCQDGWLLAFYGNGVVWSRKVDSSRLNKVSVSHGFGVVRRLDLPPFPFNSKRQQLGVKVGKSVTSGSGSRIWYLRDDWETKGDWWGRYGKRCAKLCAMSGERGDVDVYGGDPDQYRISGRIGPNDKGDGLRRWVHWLSTDNRNSLWLNSEGVRRQADWDDHGEAYERDVDGPDLKVLVRVPKGMHDVAFYFFNKDGREGVNIRRDYIIEASVYDPKNSVFSMNNTHEYPTPGKFGNIYARARVKDFTQGVYKIFRVQGGEEYLFSIKRRGSLNAILSGVFVSGASEDKESQDRPFVSTMLCMGGVVYQPPVVTNNVKSALSFTAIMKRLDEAKTPVVYDNARMELGSLYAEVAQSEEDGLTENFRWRMLRWNSCDRDKFAEYMKLGWIGSMMKNPRRMRVSYSPYGMNTLDDEVCDTRSNWGYSLSEWIDKVPLRRREHVKEPYAGFWKDCVFATCVFRSPVWHGDEKKFRGFKKK